MKLLNKYFKQNFLNKNSVITILCIFGFLGLVVYPASTTLAQTPPDRVTTPTPTTNFNLKCNFKINKADCINKYKDCMGVFVCEERVDTKKANILSFGGNIHKVCQAPDISSAQDCHRAVQAADCVGPVNNTPAKLAACKSKAAEPFRRTGAASGGGAVAGPNVDRFFTTKGAAKKFTCGSGDKAAEVRFNFGCEHKAENPIVDMAYAFIKFLTIGVGLVLAVSIILAGIMYTTSGGNAEQTSKAKDRILNAMIGLIFYLLISALANFLIPGGLF